MNEQKLNSADASAFLVAFTGAELTGVFTWKFGVTLHFNDEPMTITIENNAEVRSHSRTEIFGQEIIVGFGARMLTLVGRRIADIQALDGNVFRLGFDEGTTLTLRPDASGYESYQIACPAGMWVA